MTQKEAYDVLVSAVPAQLDAVTTKLGLPKEFLPHPNAPIATRATEIIGLVKQREDWVKFEQALTEVFPSPTPDYWFFLSHSDGDRDEWLVSFYRDLSNEIRKQNKLKNEIVGFFRNDKTEFAKDWRAATVNALKTCRVFICLYSETYFGTKDCGKEWTIFRSRHTGPGLPPPLMIPIYWDAPERIPKRVPRVVGEIKYQEGYFGDPYAKYGLRRLVKLENSYRKDYLNFLEKLVKLIAEVAEKHTLPQLLEVPAFEEVANAFDGPMLETGATTTRFGSGGPAVAKFVFVAGRIHEIQGLRQRIDWYGTEGGQDWKPYLPLSEGDVGLLAQGIAWKGRFRYEVIPLDDDLARRLDEARRNNHIVVILVDAWTIRLSPYSDFMREYDRRSYLNCAVLIPWNPQDQETTQQRQQLEEALRDAFPNKDAKNPQYFRDAIESDRQLRIQLRNTLNKIWNQITQTAKPRDINGSDRSNLPVLPVPPTEGSV